MNGIAAKKTEGGSGTCDPGEAGGAKPNQPNAEEGRTPKVGLHWEKEMNV